MTGNTNLFYNVATSQVRIGTTNEAGFLTSASPNTITFSSIAGTGNIQNYLNNATFNGTYKLGNDGVVAINHVNGANGTNTRLNMGVSASTGRHILQTGTILAVE